MTIDITNKCLYNDINKGDDKYMEKSTTSDKLQALESAVRKMEKDCGKGSIMK